ncbi:fused MFS/spermidine synthase [Rarobacter faecitabidus]
MQGETIELSHGTAHIEPDRDASRAFTLFVNGVPSSYIDLADPTRLGFEYLEIMQAIIDALHPGRIRVTHLGGAACSLARTLCAERPDSVHIAIEIDELLASFAREWLDLPRSPQLRIRTGDARAALAGMRSESADVIVRDAFAGDTTPAHLTTEQFFAEAARVLAPGGILLANIADKPPLSLVKREISSAIAGFGHQARLAIAAEPGILRGRRYGNIVMVVAKPWAAETNGARERWDSLAAIERPLRTLPTPVRVLLHHEAVAFSAGAPAIID